ncbi:Crp/Fnr family transcriptional regulator [Brevundimonas sp.]|uniref:Crp/Fnr family transcriptional regulator n=1 Tax=Brevundimonas sp. TaxID=1871086 RepID=UPI003F70BD39
MTNSTQVDLLLSGLGKEDADALYPFMSTFNFEEGDEFGHAGDDVSHLYFVNHGIISAVSMMKDGESAEAYMVGSEGFTGVTAWQVPSKTSVRFYCHLAGSALRIKASKLRELASDSAPLRTALAGYDAALQVELEKSAPCNALHPAAQRFAKWLLRAHDRANGDILFMTQDFLAKMLGVQRSTVNESAQTLARAGAISYSRGRVQIRDRTTLLACACECYLAPEAARAPSG